MQDTATVTATVTKQLDTLTAFARTDDGLEVFIPALLAKSEDLMVGDTRTFYAKVQVGMTTDFKAMKVVEDATSAEEPVELEGPSLEKRILRFLAANGISTPRMIADALQGEEEADHVIPYALKLMHKEGKISRAAVYGSGKQEKASFVLYALTCEVFVALSV